MPSIFAITTRGLEDISAQELGEREHMTISQIAYRRILAQCDGSLAPLLALRSVDDVFLDLAHWSGIGRPRSTLAELRHLVTQLELEQARSTVAQLRPVAARPRFSVSANFVGKRNYSSDEIKFALAEGIETCSGWYYVEDDRQADLNIRLFIEHEDALLGMRLAEHALHERSYKIAHQPGSLKPPVAAAMLRLAQVQSAETVLDPFCGSGTILIEAALSGANAAGGDTDALVLEAARRNIQAAGVQVRLEQWDAQQLPLEDGSIDCIVSNLPWGRQISVDTGLTSLYQQACVEMRRVLRPDGHIVLLTSLPELVHIPELTSQQREISLFGQIATILYYGRAYREKRV